MTRIALLLAGSLLALVLATAPARASGINCAKAATPVEKLLCTDPGLKKADADVADAFAAALAASADPSAVRASQREWLAKRNACPDAACLAALHAGRIQELSAMATETRQQALAERARLRAILGWPEDCEQSFQDLVSPQGRDADTMGTGVATHALGDGRMLFVVQCDQAAYQSTFVVLLQDKADGPGRLLRFPLYDREGGKVTRSEGTDLAGLDDFNDKTKELSIYYKGRGIGDCGSQVRYAFPVTGAPKVVEARAKGCSKNPTEKDADVSTWPLVKNP